MDLMILPLAVNLVSEHLLLLFSILIFAAVLVTKVGSRYGVPSLLLFLHGEEYLVEGIANSGSVKG